MGKIQERNEKDNLRGGKCFGSTANYSSAALDRLPTAEEEELKDLVTASRTTAEVSELFTQQFSSLLEHYEQAWTNYASKMDVFLLMVRDHGLANFITMLLFLLAGVFGTDQVWKALLFFIAVTTLFVGLEGFFVWARARELRSRCITALANAVGEAGDDMPSSSPQPQKNKKSNNNTIPSSTLDPRSEDGDHRSGDDDTIRLRDQQLVATEGSNQTFFEGPLEGLHVTTIALQGDSFRPQHIIRDGKIVIVPKLLVAKGDWILNRATLTFSKFNESDSLSKLHDAIRLAIERCPVILAPVDNKASARPYLPNLELADDAEEDEVSSDDSDDEREPRSCDLGGNVTTVPQQMEYFVRRLFLLCWMVLMVILIALGVARAVISSNKDLGTDLFYYPAIACLGLLPLNVLIAQRLFVLGSNAALGCQLDRLMTEEYASFFHEYSEKDLPTPTFHEIWKEVKSILDLEFFHKIMCLSRNPVETLGTATVLAPLDSDGILTDQIPIPQRVLFVNRRPEDERDGDSDDENTFFAPAEEVAEDEKKRMKLRVAKKKQHDLRSRFRAQRFTQMGLCPSAEENLAVTFEDERLLPEKRGNINSLVLCALIHSVHNAVEPSNASPENSLLRHVDDTPMWSRCCHWLSRAAGFTDTLAARYKPLRRIVQIETKNSTHKSNPQMCSLLLQAHTGELHLFSLGTVDMILPSCSTYWAEDSLEEFDSDVKKELWHFALEEWHKGRQYQVVACSHRVVPERYQALLLDSTRVAHQTKLKEQKAASSAPTTTTTSSPPPPPPVTVEDYYLDGKRIGPKVTNPAGGGGHTNSNYAPETLRDPLGLNFSQNELKESAVYLGMSNPSHFKMIDLDAVFTRQLLCVDDTGQKDGASVFFEDSFNNGRNQKDADPPRFVREKVRTTDDLEQLLQEANRDDEDDLFTPKERRMGVNRVPEEVLRRLLTTRQAFLGFVGLRDCVRSNVEAVVSALSSAGIRFMHFGNDTEKHTSAFGARIGLEVEWNSCVSLRQSNAINLEEKSKRAQLPHGIPSIRQHLMFKDNIPLLVSLFSHCKTVSTRAMISVLQDNHEVVCALGSGLNHGCIRSFLQSDIAITTTPSFNSIATEKNNFMNRECEEQLLNNDMDSPTWRTLDKVTKLTSSLCAVQVPPHASALSIILCLIRESRLLLRMISNCTEFMLYGNAALVVLHVISLVLGMPLLISPLDTVWFLNAFIPILGIGVAYRRMSSVDVMKQLKAKHCYSVRWGIFKHSAWVFMMTHIPTVLITIFCGTVILSRATGVPVHKILWHDPAALQQEKLDEAQGVILCIYSYFTIFQALTHISRHQQLRLWAPVKNRKRRYVYVVERVRWMICSVLCIFLQILYLVLSGNEGDVFRLGASSAEVVPGFVVVLVSLWPLVIIATDFPMKGFRWNLFMQRQKFRKLMFGTRLGMHSPVGDYEPVDEEAAGQEAKVKTHATSLSDKVERFVFFFTTTHDGRLERQCVCDECRRWH